MLKRIIAVVFCFVFCMLFAIGCSNDAEQVIDLVINGETEYKIVMPSNADSNEEFAKSEIVNFFYQATDIKLESIKDTDANYSSDSKYIVLGKNNALVNKTEISVNDLKPQSYLLKTVDKNIFILGGDSLGTLYGAYAFLAQAIDYECYAPQEIHFNSSDNVKISTMNILDGPDIQWRQPSFMDIDSSMNSSRMKMTSSIWIKERGNFVHNTFSEYLSRYKDNDKKKGDSTVFTEHPKWFASKSENPTGEIEQLCYSAHGDATELALMQDAVFERMKALVASYWDKGDFRESISFTHEDNSDWCTCPKCSEEYDKYGTDSAVVIHFLNPIARRLKEWIDSVPAYRGHDLYVVFFAYYKTQNAPVIKSNGNYELIDSTVKCEDNLAVLYAPIDADFYKDFYNPSNEDYRETMLKWKESCSNMYLWLYCSNFRNYLAWYNTFDSIQGNYELAKLCNTKYIYDEGKYNDSGMSGFDMFKQYLQCKLSWNVKANVEVLKNNFFDNYYRDASSTMKKYYDDFRSWTNYIVNNLNAKGGCFDTLNKNHYPKQVLKKWLQYIDDAYNDLEPLKAQDKELYQTIKDRITVESMSIRYQMINFYGSSFNSVDLLEMKKLFKADAERLGFVYINEQSSLADSVYPNWGV